MNIKEIANRIANLHYPDVPKTRGDKMFRRQRVIELQKLIESELKNCATPDEGRPLPPNECEKCGVLIDSRLNECGDCRL